MFTGKHCCPAILPRVPYKVRTVALGPEQRSPEHLARQPFGQAPAIEEDGLVLFESRKTS